MNDKEKKAIKRCYRRINELKLNFAITNEDLNAIKTVLNLIEKQKAEIENKDKQIDLMAEEILYENNCSGELDFEIYKDKEEVIKDFEKKAEEDKQYVKRHNRTYFRNWI